MNTMDNFGAVTDKVILKDIAFEAVVGLDAWHRSGLEAAANEDAVSLTIDYGKLYKALKGAVFGQSFDSVTKLYQAVKSSVPDTVSWYISVSLPKAVLASRNGICFSWNGVNDGIGAVTTVQEMKLKDLECACIIGVNSHERLEKQRLLISIVTAGVENRLSQSIFAGVSLDPSPNLVYQDMIQDVVERIEGSAYETIEALATAIAQTVTVGYGFDNARITIEKPGGVAGYGASGVSIGRTKTYFENKDFWKVKRP